VPAVRRARADSHLIAEILEFDIVIEWTRGCWPRHFVVVHVRSINRVAMIVEASKKSEDFI
jgi:hypothetical protein